MLLSDQFALVSFFRASAKLVLHLTQLVLGLLLLAKHGLKLAFLVISRRLILVPQRLQLLRQTFLFRGQLVHSRLSLAKLLLELSHICLAFNLLKHLISLLGGHARGTGYALQISRCAIGLILLLNNSC